MYTDAARHTRFRRDNLIFKYTLGNYASGAKWWILRKEETLFIRCLLIRLNAALWWANDRNKQMLYSVNHRLWWAPMASVILNTICSITSTSRTGCVYCSQEVWFNHLWWIYTQYCMRRWIQQTCCTGSRSCNKSFTDMPNADRIPDSNDLVVLCASQTALCATHTVATSYNHSTAQRTGCIIFTCIFARGLCTWQPF